LRPQALAGLVLAAMAISLGLALAGAALRLRRRRAQFAPTYAATGGALYTALQLGCAGFLVLTGLVLISLALILR
jgi:hypothetical protein